MGGSASLDSYDSTWEEDEEDSSMETERSTKGSKEAICPKTQKTPRNRKKRNPKKFNYKYMFSKAARDMQSYRRHYQPPGLNYQSSPDEMPNLKFYRNQMKFQPNGLCIDDLLRNWKDQYDILESNHEYIQWLFPLRVQGRNPHALPLHEDEIKIMKNDEDVRRRLCEAYKLMLGFYGLQLKDESSGTVGRAENWQERYRKLDSKSHNNLRITRILMCLGELGYEHYQKPLIYFFLDETICNGNLQNVKWSVLDYFIFSVRDKKERKTMVQFAFEHFEPKDEFIWGPVKLLQYGSHTRSKGTYSGNNVISEEPTGCWHWCC